MSNTNNVAKALKEAMQTPNSEIKRSNRSKNNAKKRKEETKKAQRQAYTSSSAFRAAREYENNKGSTKVSMKVYKNKSGINSPAYITAAANQTALAGARCAVQTAAALANTPEAMKAIVGQGFDRLKNNITKIATEALRELSKQSPAIQDITGLQTGNTNSSAHKRAHSALVIKRQKNAREGRHNSLGDMFKRVKAPRASTKYVTRKNRSTKHVRVRQRLKSIAEGIHKKKRTVKRKRKPKKKSKKGKPRSKKTTKRK